MLVERSLACVCARVVGFFFLCFLYLLIAYIFLCLRSRLPTSLPHSSEEFFQPNFIFFSVCCGLCALIEGEKRLNHIGSQSSKSTQQTTDDNRRKTSNFLMFLFLLSASHESIVFWWCLRKQKKKRKEKKIERNEKKNHKIFH